MRRLAIVHDVRAVLLVLLILLPSEFISLSTALAQRPRVEPKDVALQLADLPPDFTVSSEEAKPMDPGPGVIYAVRMERPLTPETAASGPLLVSQLIARFDSTVSYDGFLNEMRRRAIEEDGFELVPGAPNDGGTASLQRFKDGAAAFEVGFIKRDMVIFTRWFGRRDAVSLDGLLTLAGVSSARYDQVLASGSGVPTPPPASSPSATEAPPAPSADATGQARIGNTSGTGANLRALPIATSELLQVVGDGEHVMTIGVEETGADGRRWRNIRTGGGVTGWVVAEYVVADGQTTAATPRPPAPSAAPPPPTPKPAPANPPIRRSADGLAIATSYELPKVGPPRNDTDFPCLALNPSCARHDPWWVEWNALPMNEGDFVQFSFVGPSLVAERHFIEAIWLLWQWDEGKRLLRAAGDHGVSIFAIELAEGPFAYWRGFSQVIVVNKRFAETSTWMLADVLAHELQHALDHKNGLNRGNSSAECLAGERSAYGVELSYLKWLARRFGGLPGPSAIAGRLTAEDFALYSNLYEIGTSSDLDATVRRDYRKSCAR